MNSFLLDSSLIRVLGAEQSASKDRQKFPGKGGNVRGHENFGQDANILAGRASTTSRYSTAETPPI